MLFGTLTGTGVLAVGELVAELDGVAVVDGVPGVVAVAVVAVDGVPGVIGVDGVPDVIAVDAVDGVAGAWGVWGMAVSLPLSASSLSSSSWSSIGKRPV